jgi:hypothetical protein
MKTEFVHLTGYCALAEVANTRAQMGAMLDAYEQAHERKGNLVSTQRRRDWRKLHEAASR